MVASTSLVRLSTGSTAISGGSGFLDTDQLLINRDSDDPAVAAFEHHGGADHDLIAVLAGRPRPQLAANADLGNVLEIDGDAALAGENDVAEVFRVLNAPASPHDVGFTAPLDVARADSGIVALDCFNDIAEREPEREQLVRIGSDLELLLVTADRIDLGNPRDGLQLRTDDPVLHRAQIHGQFIVLAQPKPFRREVGAVALPAGLAVLGFSALTAWVGVFDRPHVDLAKTRRNRPHLWLDTLRQGIPRLRKPLCDLCPREIDVDLVAEDDRHLRERVARNRTRVFKARDPGERGLDGKRDALFHLERRERRGARVDLHLIIGDIGHSIDRKQLKRARHQRRRAQPPPARRTAAALWRTGEYARSRVRFSAQC